MGGIVHVEIIINTIVDCESETHQPRNGRAGAWDDAYCLVPTSLDLTLL